MNCYRHSEIASIGTCKACQKGLCRDCVTDTGNGLACKDSCEQEVREVNEMWERSKRIYGIGKYNSRIPTSGVLIWSLFAVGFWVVAIVLFLKQGEVDVMTITMACLFTIILGIAYWSARRTGLKC
jgi:hypothetical protein